MGLRLILTSCLGHRIIKLNPRPKAKSAGEAAKRSVALIVDCDLLVNAAKYTTAQPILAINPDPQRVDGILIPFSVQEAGEAVAQAVAGRLRL